MARIWARLLALVDIVLATDEIFSGSQVPEYRCQYWCSRIVCRNRVVRRRRSATCLLVSCSSSPTTQNSWGLRCVRSPLTPRIAMTVFTQSWLNSWKSEGWYHRRRISSRLDFSCHVASVTDDAKRTRFPALAANLDGWFPRPFTQGTFCFSTGSFRCFCCGCCCFNSLQGSSSSDGVGEDDCGGEYFMPLVIVGWILKGKKRVFGVTC